MDREFAPKFNLWIKKDISDIATLPEGLKYPCMVSGDDIKFDECYSLNAIFIELEKRDVPILEFTGLLDNEDVEIYDGDILEHTRGIHFVFEQSELPWAGWEMVSNHKYYGNDINENGFARREYKKIGNRYENPELMEESTIP